MDMQDHGQDCISFAKSSNIECSWLSLLFTKIQHSTQENYSSLEGTKFVKPSLDFPFPFVAHIIWGYILKPQAWQVSPFSNRMYWNDRLNLDHTVLFIPKFMEKWFLG